MHSHPVPIIPYPMNTALLHTNRKGKVDYLPQCGVIALAFAKRLEISYTFELVKKKFERSDNWKGRMYHDQVSEMLEEFGIPFDYYDNQKIKLEQLCMIGADKRMIISSRNHITYYESGLLVDQYHNGPWYERDGKGMKRKVRAIWHLK